MFIVVLLALVQGVAEFLPISSSGHLVTIGALFGQLPDEPTLEIILHAGTLGSILVIYWRRIVDLLSSDRRVIPLLVVGTIPAAIVGVTIKSQLTWLLRSPILAATMLLVTAAMLIVLGRLAARDRSYQTLSYGSAVLIGCFQAFAVLPGISRSGSTILGGRLMGLSDDDSVTFSFLLAIPAIGGATVLTLKDLLDGEGAAIFTGGQLAIGAAVSFLVGILALRWLIAWSKRGQLHWFAWWCIPFALFVLLRFGGSA